jgi:hypothetical protein
MADLTEQVSSGTNDGYIAGANFYTVGSAYFGNSAGTSLNAFFRFSAVTIPVGAYIVSAKVQFKAASNWTSTTVNLKLHFEAADSPSAPTSASDYNGRSVTTGVTWSGVGSWTSGTWYDSPSLVSDLQAIIDRGGWAENNAINLFVKNDGSSSNAYRSASGYDDAAADAAKLVVTYNEATLADLTDSAGANDSASAFSLTDSISDAAGSGDSAEGYDFKGTIDDAAGQGDSSGAFLEAERALEDAAGIGDAVSSGYELEAVIPADQSGFLDSADAFNWTDWLDQNLDKAVARYYCTITGAADNEEDVEVPISSFQARKRNGYSTYLSVVIPGVAYADAISARANGEIIVEMAYLINGVESLREEILRADLEQINIYEGTSSRSITLIGHQEQTFVAKESRLYNPAYKQLVGGEMSFRFAVPDLWLNPGDTARVGDDAFTVETVIYMVAGGGGQTVMEVQE